MPGQPLANVAGLAGGADYLRNLLAQREAQRIAAEQEHYNRTVEAQKLAISGREVGAKETTANADLLKAQAPPPKKYGTILGLQSIGPDGKPIAVTRQFNEADPSEFKDLPEAPKQVNPPGPTIRSGIAGSKGPLTVSFGPTGEWLWEAPDYQKPEAPTAANIQIKPGSSEYRQAQDMADGTLTMTDFQRLHSRAQADAGMRGAIYDLARTLNPNFNPAQFEIGHAFARSPKVQAQIASIKNVESGVPDILKFSDAATRSGSPTLNQWAVKPVSIAFGGKAYSNFKTAVTAFADELSGALGYGSATDMSRDMGFDMTDMNQSPENFKSNMTDVVLPFVARKKASMIGQMGPYGGQQNQTGGGTGQFVVKDPNGESHNFDTQAQADAARKRWGVK